MKRQMLAFLSTILFSAFSMAGGGGPQSYTMFDCGRTASGENLRIDYLDMHTYWVARDLAGRASNQDEALNWGTENNVFHINFASGSTYRGEPQHVGSRGALTLSEGKTYSCVQIAE